MAKAENRWDHVETDRGTIRVTHDNVPPLPSLPKRETVQHVSESREQSLGPNVQGQRRPFWRGVWPAIRRVRFWLTVRVVLAACVCVVLIVVTVNLVGFLIGTHVGRTVCTVMGFLVVFVGFLIAKNQGFFG